MIEHAAHPKSDSPKSDSLCELLRYWTERLRGRAIPSRADIDPIELRSMLGYLTILEVVPPAAPGAPPQFRYRLHGVHVTRAMGCDMTGKFVSDLPSKPYADEVTERLLRVVAERRPVVSTSQWSTGERTTQYEIIWLPLSSDDVHIDRLLGGVAILGGVDRHLAVQRDRNRRLAATMDQLST